GVGGQSRRPRLYVRACHRWHCVENEPPATCRGMRAVIGPAAPPGDDQADQQPSYGAQLDSPPAAMAFANTWFCSATLACPKSAGLPPYAAQVAELNW